MKNKQSRLAEAGQPRQRGSGSKQGRQAHAHRASRPAEHAARRAGARSMPAAPATWRATSPHTCSAALDSSRGPLPASCASEIIATSDHITGSLHSRATTQVEAMVLGRRWAAPRPVPSRGGRAVNPAAASWHESAAHRVSPQFGGARRTGRGPNALARSPGGERLKAQDEDGLPMVHAWTLASIARCPLQVVPPLTHPAAQHHGIRAPHDSQRRCEQEPLSARS